MARRLLAALVAAAALLPPTRRPSTALRAALTELPTQQPENPVAEAEIRYDPDKAQKLLTRQPRRWLTRNVQLFFPLAGFIMSIISDRAMNCEPQRREQRASELLELISNLGPAAGDQRRAGVPAPSTRLVSMTFSQQQAIPAGNSRNCRIGSRPSPRTRRCDASEASLV